MPVTPSRRDNEGKRSENPGGRNTGDYRRRRHRRKALARHRRRPTARREHHTPTPQPGDDQRRQATPKDPAPAPEEGKRSPASANVESPPGRGDPAPRSPSTDTARRPRHGGRGRTVWHAGEHARAGSEAGATGGDRRPAKPIVPTHDPLGEPQAHGACFTREAVPTTPSDTPQTETTARSRVILPRLGAGRRGPQQAKSERSGSPPRGRADPCPSTPPSRGQKGRAAQACTRRQSRVHRRLLRARETCVRRRGASAPPTGITRPLRIAREAFSLMAGRIPNPN